MTTTGRSESINSFVKRFTSSHVCLSRFIKQGIFTAYSISNEYQAQDMLTPFAFKKFQEEFSRATQYLLFLDGTSDFIGQYYKEGGTQKHKVHWDKQVASCSCKHFEFWGILCRHILSVFIHEHVFEIPLGYFPLRWCRQVSLGEEGSLIVDEEEGEDNNEIDMIDILQCPPKSKTKGRPKQKRLRV
ncbi:Zinc finger, PMZ-type [Sesbania bispinosa]|nr:Zinc finger, PMZ-type [Sesbania bispinosa]